MEFFKKRGAAIAITVVVIVLSTLFSVHRTLGAEARKVSDSFYIGVEDKEWDRTYPSIEDQLKKRCDTANGAITLLSGYDELGDELDALRGARQNLLDAGSLSQKGANNHQLALAFNELREAASYMELTQREETAMEEYEKTMKGAQSRIDSSGYNELVREFGRSTLGVFPTNILKKLAFVEEPQLFE